jgi:predicted DNA-binding antitoxin AbrB/MazE fold protein
LTILVALPGCDHYPFATCRAPRPSFLLPDGPRPPTGARALALAHARGDARLASGKTKHQQSQSHWSSQTLFISIASIIVIKEAAMSESPDAKILVVYEGGVFKPLQDVDLLEGTKAFVVLKPGRITNVARRYRIKVDRDVMSEFVEERR